MAKKRSHGPEPGTTQEASSTAHAITPTSVALPVSALIAQELRDQT